MDRELLDVILRLRGSAAGGEAARELDRALRPRLRRYFARGPWPADEAEDLVQKTLTLVYSGVEHLEHPDRFLGWLFAIARNVRRTAAGEAALRRGVEVQADDFDALAPPSGARDAEGDAIERQRLVAVCEAIARLPSRQRQCLLLRVREELSYEEIAALLCLSPLTVRNHIAQAKESLRKTLTGGRSDR